MPNIRPQFSFLKIALYTMVVALFTPLISASAAGAISGNDFKPGNIIQDQTFYNNGSMNAAEIQAFLNSKVPNCTSGYTCLKSYTEDAPTKTDALGLCGTHAGGRKVAAQIIYDVSLVCGVNPQVLITLLQKEQALVTSTQPSAIQYRSATGYACPDTAACSSEYYGFFNQVYKAAWQYKYYAKYSNTYSYRPYRTNSILWNPQASCGRSDVYIENQSTASLYIYTPYRPNQAALNNLYGTGDSCSSYGNRNFWRIFSDWFGIDNKPLMRTVSSGDLYYVAGQYKYKISSMDVAAEYGFSTSDVAFVSQSTIDTTPTSPRSNTLSYIAKSDSDADEDGGNIYLISGKKRYLITSMEQFAMFGLSTNNLTYLPYFSLVRMPLAGNMSQFVTNPAGFVYKVTNGVKQGIFQGDYYNKLNPGGNVASLSNHILSTLQTGPALIDGVITLQSGDGRLWLASEAGWNYIASMSIARCLGVQSSIISFTPDQSIQSARGPDASCIVKSPNESAAYILDGAKKYLAHPEWDMPSPTQLDASLLNTKQTIQLPYNSPFQDKNGAIYTLKGGAKRYFPDMVAVDEYRQKQAITSVNSDFLATIGRGPDWLSSGTILGERSSGKLFVINNDSRLYIPSMELYTSFGFDKTNIQYLESSSLERYPVSGTLESTVRLGAQPFILDRAIGWLIPEPIQEAYGVNSQSPSYSVGLGRYAMPKTATRYIKADNSAQLYYLDNGRKHPVYSWQAFTSLGGSNETISVLSAAAVDKFTNGAPY